MKSLLVIGFEQLLTWDMFYHLNFRIRFNSLIYSQIFIFKTCVYLVMNDIIISANTL
jgi:hypothetical protein